VPEALSPAAHRERLPTAGVFVPLQLLTRWDDWAWVRASFTSWPKYTPGHASLKPVADLRSAVLRMEFAVGEAELLRFAQGARFEM
jgi:hypothetical protein